MRALRALAVFLLLAPGALASMTTSALTGRVVIDGKAGAGVTVTVTSPALQGSRSATTNRRGEYYIDALPPGVYDVSFSKPGHSSLTHKATLELARVARADGEIQPSEDEESTSSTIETRTVAETTMITEHANRESFERKPVESTLVGASSIYTNELWGTFLIEDFPESLDREEEAIDQVTAVFGALGPEYDGRTSRLFLGGTRRGGEELALTLRGTISQGPEHALDAAASGRVLPERLWFFVTGRVEDHYRGVLATLTGHPGAAHNVELTHHTSTITRFRTRHRTSLQYTGVIRDTTTVQARAGYESRHYHRLGTFDQQAFALRVSHVVGDHVLSLGGQNTNPSPDNESNAFFLNDRWSAGRLTVNAGARFETYGLLDPANEIANDAFLPRFSAAYDLLGDGRRALFASWGEYLTMGRTEEGISSFGFATSLGKSGTARIDWLHSDARSSDEWRLSANYRLFDRFEAGGTFSNGHVEYPFEYFGPNPRSLTAWVGLELPIGEQEIGATVLERVIDYRSYTAHYTDLALRYALAMNEYRLTFAADLRNAFDHRGDLFIGEREARLWVRITH